MPRIFCFALCLGLLQSPSFAQFGALDELYGEGVHRYFSADLNGADQILTQVVDSGSQDPRAYYFRGSGSPSCTHRSSAAAIAASTIASA